MAGKSKEWPRIYPKPNPGGSISWVVDQGMVNGKRERDIYKTKAAAEACAQELRVQRGREGKEATKFPFEDRVMALHCINRLKIHGVQLDTAVDDYMKYILPSRQSKTVNEIMVDFIARAVRKAQKSWKKDLEDFRRRFCPRFGDQKLSKLKKEELQEWLDGQARLHQLAPRSLQNYKNMVSYLFKHGRGDKELLENLALRLDVPPPSEDLPGFYSIEETRALLFHAPDYDLVPYVAIRAFAGLRRCEVVRLDWSRVRNKWLDVTAKSTKRTKKSGRARRLVRISDTLAAWLAPFRNRTGPVIGKGSLDYRMGRVKVAAGINHPSKNFFRHGYATYHLAAYDNDDETSRALGHVDTNMLHGTYKGREVEQEDGQKYFTLTPETVFPNGVIPSGSGKYTPASGPGQRWITPDGPNPFRSGTLISVVFARGSKGFIRSTALIQALAAELSHSPDKVKHALYSATNPKHKDNGGRCMAQWNATGEIRLVALPVGKVVDPVKENALVSSVTPLVETAVIASYEVAS